MLYSRSMEKQRKQCLMQLHAERSPVRDMEGEGRLRDKSHRHHEKKKEDPWPS